MTTIAALVLAPAVHARAQEQAGVPELGPGETSIPPPGTDTPVKEKKKKKDEETGRFQVKGRVFARAAYEKRTDLLLGAASMPSDLERLRLSIPSARVGMRYDVLDWVALAVEADVADRPLLRDAFVAARSKHLRGRAGQFKMPVSAINLESPWNLPVARRGIIQGLLHDRWRVIGRRPGVSGSLRGGGALDPELAVGAFQGAYQAPDADVELIGAGEISTAVDAQNLVARVSITPGGQEIALVGARVSTLEPQGRDGWTLRHFWAAGADATLDEPFGVRGLRAWLEGLAGRTYYPTIVDGTLTGYRDATWWAGRAIVAWRWAGEAQGDGYFEPFVFYGIADPSTDGGDDMLWELAAGVNVGYWRRVRLTLQFELAKGQRGIPVGLWLDGRNLDDHKAVLLQAGAAF